MQTILFQKQIAKVRPLKTTLRAILTGIGCVTTAFLLGLTLVWQPYSDLNEIERELSNETYLRVVSELQHMQCVYHKGDWLPYLVCESPEHKRIKLAYEVLIYDETPFYYSPFYVFQTEQVLQEFRNKPLIDK